MTEDHRPQLITDLDRFRSKPLSEINPDEARQVIKDVLRRDAKTTTAVEVARFGSAI